MSRSRLAAALAGAVLLASCGQDDKPAPGASASAPASKPQPAGTPAPAATAAGDAAKGKQVWFAQCVACHNVDPSKDGPLGPAVKGSSRELLEARVVLATYPPAYKPKRETKVMPARPDLAASVPDLYAFLH